MRLREGGCGKRALRPSLTLRRSLLDLVPRTKSRLRRRRSPKKEFAPIWRSRWARGMHSVSGNSAAVARVVAHPVRSRLKPRTGCRTRRDSDYYFFFAAFFFAGFFAAAFDAFFFMAILSLLKWSLGWRPSGQHTHFVARPRTKTIRRISSYTILSRECSTSFEAINDSLSDSSDRNRRHGDRVVSRVERAQHREEVRRRLLDVAANRKVERR
jgi:hypothetical protein